MDVWLGVGHESEDAAAGIFNDNGSSPTVTNCMFSANLANFSGGGIFNDNNSSPTVANCTFSGNTANIDAGGMGNWEFSSPTVTNCTFTVNSANSGGGGMRNHVESCSTVTNCTFSGNSAIIGGGMCNSFSSSPIVNNCTFSGNSANKGGGICNYDSSSTITNCILWGNAAPDGNEIALNNSSTIDVNYCDIQAGLPGIYDDGTGNTISWGPGNIDADPLFIDPNGPDGTIGTVDDDLHLLPNSPCIDAGDPNTPLDPNIDLDGRERFVDGDCDGQSVVDMGVYEFTLADFGDFNRTCDINLFDFAIFAQVWLTDENDPAWNNLFDLAAPMDGFIDLKDFMILYDNWLVRVE